MVIKCGEQNCNGQLDISSPSAQEDDKVADYVQLAFYPHSKERDVLTRKELTGERRMLQVIYLVTSCCSPQLHSG
jgi:hypothetical protein